MVRVLQEHGPERIIVNSACDWGVSDPLKVRKTADAMKAAGFDDDEIDRSSGATRSSSSPRAAA